jgi:D-arabinose 1-dehydrogenase-like Zn-dependent alcohol dehydrogenase
LTSAAAADYLTGPANLAARAPVGLDLVAAAVLPTVGLTALVALRTTRVRAGSALLVVGANGGVGSATVQLARATGATVATISSPTRTLTSAPNSARATPTPRHTTPSRCCRRAGDSRAVQCGFAWCPHTKSWMLRDRIILRGRAR